MKDAISKPQPGKLADLDVPHSRLSRRRRRHAVVEVTSDSPIRVDAPGALILIQPKRDGEPDREIAAERRDQEHRRIVLTSPKAMDVDITQRYVCQIHAWRHINVCALNNGYLSELNVRDGQAVKKGDQMFKIADTSTKAKLDAELADVLLAELEYKNAKRMFEEKKIISQNELQLFEAKLARAKAKAELAKRDLNFTNVIAPFDGVLDRLHVQLGSLIKEGDLLTTLSDNSVMWVYFNVPENQYLEYMANPTQHEGDKIELLLANHTKFPQPGKFGAMEAKFNSETGTIAFRADFPNAGGLLRHGQSGTILIHRKVHDATVIPMRATLEIMDKRYVYVVDKDDVSA